MNMLRPLLLAVSLGILAAPGHALAGPSRESDRAFEDTREGKAMPLPQIKRRVMPLMPDSDYLGPELNGSTYRLKFIRNGRVIWVDVDARTGRIIRKSGD